MRLAKALSVAFLLALSAALLPLPATAQPAAEIEPALLQKLEAEGSANYFVVMAVQADLSAAYGMDWEARGLYVWNTLNEVARVSQAPVIDYARKQGLDYRSMLTTNSVFIRGGTLEAARDLARIPGVAYLRLERIYPLPDPLSGPGAGVNGRIAGGQPSPEVKAWGVMDIKADQVWALGFQGSGIKVANIDTGVQWNHPALDQAFACPGQPSNPACWYDPANICGGSACDNNGHGTHTMGTMVGDDDPALLYQVGMAPDAKWIACKGCETNSCSDSSLNACADWILAPAGNPSNRPHVVNNSWGGSGGDDWYLVKVNAWRASGIFPAFSAGNLGPGCGTLGSPGDYQQSFASAAHDSARAIASFSSRGPSAYGHDPHTKPNISAPGVDICSSVPTNGWNCTADGTSMASPHSAGAVALVWSACPDLRAQIDPTMELLQYTANPPPAGNCGAPPDGQGNYTYGYGYLDALAAVQECLAAQVGTLLGWVTDQDGNPLQDVTVTALPEAKSAGIEAVTDPNGFYTMDLMPGPYEVNAFKNGYTSPTAHVMVYEGQITTQNFRLFFLGAWTNHGALCFDLTRFDGAYYPATGKAYFLGGRSGTETIGNIYSYNPFNGQCADTGADMPTPISNYTIVTLNFGGVDHLCTFGGRDTAGNMIRTVQCYNPNTNAVVTKADLPVAFDTYLPGGVAVVNNKAYIFGGFRSTATPYHISVTYEYNPATNSYTAKGNLSLGRGYIDAAVVDGKIYAFGGDIFDGASLIAQTRAERFDPATGNWSDAAVADLPVASGEGRAFGWDSNSPAIYRGQIILVGGGQWPNETAEVVRYRVATNTYDYSFPDLNILRRNHAHFYVPGTAARMWVVGGRSSAAGYGGDNPPYAPAESWQLFEAVSSVYLPAVMR